MFDTVIFLISVSLVGMKCFSIVMNVVFIKNALGPVIWWLSLHDLHLYNMFNSPSLTILLQLNGMFINNNIYQEGI